MAVDNSAVGVQNLKGAIELGQQTLKSLELVNGGAVIAILSFYGNVVKDGSTAPIDPTALTHGLASFATGLGAAVLAAIFAYLSQLGDATGGSHLSEAIKKCSKIPLPNLSGTGWLRVVAILCGIASFGLFSHGTYWSIASFTPSMSSVGQFQSKSIYTCHFGRNPQTLAHPNRP
jgi:hypothetical protein